MEAAQQFDNSACMGARPSFMTASSPARWMDLVHFLRDLGHHFLDARGMDAPVQDQPFHGLAGDLAAHGIKAGKHHGAGSVVNEHGDAGGGLEGADVAAFAADDAAFHFLALDADGGGGGLKAMLAGVALDGQADDFARIFLGLVFGVVQDVLGKLRGVAQAFLLDLLQKGARGFASLISDNPANSRAALGG